MIVGAGMPQMPRFKRLARIFAMPSFPDRDARRPEPFRNACNL
jgi:hypothetical protein